MIAAKYFGFAPDLQHDEFAEAFCDMVKDKGFCYGDLTCPDTDSCEFYLQLLNEIIENEDFSDLNKGDTVAPDFGYYRDELTLVFDGEQAILPDFKPDEYGSMPFPIVAPVDISFETTLCHNTITWFALAKYLPVMQVTDKLIVDQWCKFGTFTIADGDVDAGKTAIILLGRGKDSAAVEASFDKLKKATYVQVSTVQEDHGALYEVMYDDGKTTISNLDHDFVKWSAKMHKVIDEITEVCKTYDYKLCPYTEEENMRY